MLILPGADTWLSGGTAPFAAAAARFLAAGTPVARHLRRDGWPRRRSESPRRVPAHEQRPRVPGGDRVRRAPRTTSMLRPVSDGSADHGRRPSTPVEFARDVLARLDVYEPATLDASGTSCTASATWPGTTRSSAASREGSSRSSSAGPRSTSSGSNGQFLALAEELARPAGCTAARWQVVGAMMTEPLRWRVIARTMGSHPPERAAHSPTCSVDEKGLAGVEPRRALRGV